jgi:lipid A ethanolaminephosphotransferase
MKLVRPSIGSLPLSLLVAVWIIFVVNDVFWANTVRAFGEHRYPLIAFAIGMSALLTALSISVTVKYLTKPIYIIALFSAASAAWFMQKFGVIIDTDMIRNAAQTTAAEAGHLMTPAFYRHMALYAVLPSLLIAIVRIRSPAHRRQVEVEHGLHHTAAAACPGHDALAVFRHCVDPEKQPHHHRHPQSDHPDLQRRRVCGRRRQEPRYRCPPLDPDAKPGPRIAGADKPVVTIIVAGETARARNFSLGGYERKTNPELEKRDVVYFRNTSACGTSTAISIPCMFSLLTRSGYSHEGGLAQENVLDVLKHAGNDVTWWENNTGDKGVGSRITMRNFSAENDPRFCLNNECRDQVMVEALEPWLDAVQGNATLVLHQLGSHGPAYYARYTEEERLFKPDCRTAEFAACTSQEIINAYDNTIVATDRMLAQVIDLLEARSDRLASAMIYMSDHGESLGEKGLYLHGMPYMLAPSEQTHIPFIMWLSDSYSEIFGVTNACLEGRVDETLSHDNMFHTVLGLMDVNAKHYDPALDVTSGCRAPSS